MKITKRQLRRIIREEKQRFLNEALPAHLQKHFRKDGSSIHQPQIKDVTTAGYGPDEGGALLDLDDYNMLENAVEEAIENLVKLGYTREDVVQALQTIAADA